MELVLSGRAEAFETLVTPYRSSLFGLARRLTGNDEEAMEACQDTLLKAYRYLRSFDPRKSFKNWLTTILVNSSRSLMKKRSQTAFDEAASFPAEPSGSDDPEILHQRKELRRRIMDCLDVLSRGEREVFLLRDIEDRSVLETSRILGCSQLSVRVRLSSARKKIRDRLSPGPEGRPEGRKEGVR